VKVFAYIPPNAINFAAPENAVKAPTFETGATIAVANRKYGILKYVISYDLFD
jgi:hypothetical protein